MLVPRRNDLDLFDEFFGDPFFSPRHEERLMKTDVKESDDKYSIMMDLPGYEKEDIKVSVDDGYLAVSASASSDYSSDEEDGKYVRRERHYGECSRSFYVGEDITTEDVKATFRNGTLTLDVPKSEKIEKDTDKKYVQIEE